MDYYAVTVAVERFGCPPGSWQAVITQSLAVTGHYKKSPDIELMMDLTDRQETEQVKADSVGVQQSEDVTPSPLSTIQCMT